MATVPAASRDRLSDLPDCLLHAVLSSLRSRQVVQTCLLSRRWRHLWRSVPCIDVDQRDFLLLPDDDQEPPASYKERLVRELKQQSRFEDFADALLLLHDADASSPIDACRLHVADRDLGRNLHRWIRRGLYRHPAELRVAYDHDGRFFRHYDGRFHQEADQLVFSFRYASAGARSVTGRLRTLHLSGLTLMEEFAEVLESECPLLQELSLVRCESDYKFPGRIASASLKRLHIQGRGHDGFRLLRTLAVPALVSLSLDQLCLPDIEVEEPLQSLAVASVADPNEYGHGYGFLTSMRNAKVLELRSFTTTVRRQFKSSILGLQLGLQGLLEGEPESFNDFHNLRMLTLKECEIGDKCHVLRYILGNVPSLETLVLQDCKTSGMCSRDGSASSSWRTDQAFHGCKNLRSIQVRYNDDQDVPQVLVAALTQIAKDLVKPHRGQRNYVGLLDWINRVVGWQTKFLTQHHPAICDVIESDDSLSDDSLSYEYSTVWKHRARKKHGRGCTFKARRRRRAAHQR